MVIKFKIPSWGWLRRLKTGIKGIDYKKEILNMKDKKTKLGKFIKKNRQNDCVNCVVGFKKKLFKK